LLLLLLSFFNATFADVAATAVVSAIYVAALMLLLL